MTWLDADGLRMSAAIAFYSLLSLAPLLVVVVAGLGWWIDSSLIENKIVSQVESFAGSRTAAVIQQAMNSATTRSEGLIASIIAFFVLLSAATGVFVALQDSLKVIWGTAKNRDLPWWWMFVLRLRGVGYMMVLGGMVLSSLVLSAVLHIMADWLTPYIGHPWIWRFANEIMIFVLITTLFAGLMRMSDGEKPRIRYLIIGAAIGSLLFTVGKYIMSQYLSSAAAVSAYGAAGSLIALLMWMYFSSAILLLSASFAKTLHDNNKNRKEKNIILPL